jgi:probable rRNA maturation factor
MNLTVDVQVAAEGDDNPDPDSIRTWLESALQDRFDSTNTVEVCVRVVDEMESQTLNSQYRGKHSPTNVLSFPANLPKDIPVCHLGDIVICAGVVKREAEQQGKEARAHWAHMVVHGTLHLLGYDHINDADASIMESLETKILTGLLFPPPYQQQTQ